MFTALDYIELYDLAFDPRNPGYKPFSLESPNGDGKFDWDKRYAHVAMKYLGSDECTFEEEEINVLEGYLDDCMDVAMEVAVTLGIPRDFWPDKRYSALRILEYKPGAISNPHTDFDLFTLMMYRNIQDNFKYSVFAQPSHSFYMLESAKHINSQIHFGELLEAINPTYNATPHEVVADRNNRIQYSAVFFAIPDHNSILPSGDTVGEWIDERISRSRKDVY